MIANRQSLCDFCELSTALSEDTRVQVEMTAQLKLLLVLMALTNFCSTTAFSCIAPFFPRQAETKGLSAMQIGTIFGIFELIIFLMSPIWAKVMPRIGSKVLFITGLVLTGLTSILFGCALMSIVIFIRSRLQCAYVADIRLVILRSYTASTHIGSDRCRCLHDGVVRYMCTCLSWQSLNGYHVFRYDRCCYFVTALFLE